MCEKEKKEKEIKARKKKIGEKKEKEEMKKERYDKERKVFGSRERNKVETSKGCYEQKME